MNDPDFDCRGMRTSILLQLMFVRGNTDLLLPSPFSLSTSSNEHSLSPILVSINASFINLIVNLFSLSEHAHELVYKEPKLASRTDLS